MRIGSLFSGYGGLDAGVMDVLGGSVAWHAAAALRYLLTVVPTPQETA